MVIVDNNNQRGVREVRPIEGARRGIGKKNSMASHQGEKAMEWLSSQLWHGEENEQLNRDEERGDYGKETEKTFWSGSKPRD